MPRTPLLLLAAFCLVGSAAFGSMEIYEAGPPAFAGYPERFNQMLKQHRFVLGSSFQKTNSLSYQGDHGSLSRMLASLAELPNTQLTVVLHPKAGLSRHTHPSGLGPETPADWTVTFADFPQSKDGVPSYQFRVEVYLGSGAIRLSDLKVPASATVEAGGEIGEFIHKHRKRAADAAVPTKERP